MKQNDPESLIRELAATGSHEAISADVGDDVMRTIASITSASFQVDHAPLDKTPLVLGGAMVAIAASVMLVLMPSVTTLTQPWVRFWLM